MESAPHPTPREASAALAGAHASRARLADGITAPPWLFASLGLVIAAQLATAAVGLGDDRPWLLLCGLALFSGAAAAQLAWFRRRNGVWLGGFASSVVLGSGFAASAWYAGALIAAVWAAFGERWWLVALCSAAGGTGYARSGRRWLRDYRAQPGAAGRGTPAVVLAVLSVVAWVALAALALIG